MILQKLGLVLILELFLGLRMMRLIQNKLVPQIKNFYMDNIMINYTERILREVTKT